MINNVKTLTQLNVDVSQLKSQSVIKVYWNCDNCGIEKIKPYRDCINNTGLCSKCNSKKQGHYMGNAFGKTQPLKGKCLYCDISIRSQHITCSKHRKQHLASIYSGKNNPAYVGRCDIRCVCGNKKSFKAKLCRGCSFASGARSGENNGRWVKDRGKIVAARIARTLLSNTLKTTNQKKNGKTVQMLGYSFDELKLHLEAQFEPWMNWDNRGIGKNQWSIDHIIPVTILIKNGITDPQIINALWNLRPLLTSTNIKRSNVVDADALKLAKTNLGIEIN